MTAPRMVDVFDRSAATYDAVGVPWFGPIAQGLVEQLAVRPGERVLDVGCGRGAALLPLAAAAGPTGRVLGVDLAPGMVERTAADVAHLPHVEVRLADATAPGLEPGSFDVVASCLVLFFLPDPAAAVRTWTELLVPGGRLGVTTFGPQDPRWKQLDELFTPFLPPEVVQARAGGRSGPFSSDEGVEALLTGAGLDDVRTVHRTVTARFTSPAQWLEFSWSHGQRVVWEAVPPEQHDEVARQATVLLESWDELAFSQDVRHTLGRRRPAP